MAESAHPKGVLLERAQKLGLGRPEFKTERTGPEHEPSFLSDVLVDGEVLGTGQGGSKRTAEKNAAVEALAALDDRDAGGKPARGTQPSASKRRRGAKSEASTESTSSGATQAAAPAATDADDDDAPFTGPWPLFDDLLAAVLSVAEKRVSSELRGGAALEAVRDFSLQLYKELLADLGEVVDEDEEGDEEEDD